MRRKPEVQELWDSVVSKLEDPVDRSFVVEFQESTLALPVPSAFFETVIQESLKVPARVWKEVFASLLQEDSSSELRRIKVPTLIVWGDRDAFCSRQDQDALTRALVSIEAYRLFRNWSRTPLGRTRAFRGRPSELHRKVRPGVRRCGHRFDWGQGERYCSLRMRGIRNERQQRDIATVGSDCDLTGCAWSPRAAARIARGLHSFCDCSQNVGRRRDGFDDTAVGHS